MRTNLLSETIRDLHTRGRSPKDVLWVGAEGFGWFTWDEFAARADVFYDSGYGGAEVCTDLLVVGADFWLERHEYDGSEWFEFKSAPRRPDEHRVPDTLLRRSYESTLKEANEYEEEV